MKVTLWRKIRYWVLLLLVLLITISSHPMIVNMSKDAGIESGTVLSRYIIIVFAWLFVMCVNKTMLRSKHVLISWVIWTWIVLYYLITFSLFGKTEMMGDVRSIGICLIAIMIGWQLDLDEKRLRLLLLAYSGLVLFVGLMQVFTNVGGFVIRDLYVADNKNSLGVMLVSSAVVLLFLGLNHTRKGIGKLLFFVGAILVFAVLLTIRARAATLTTGIMLLFILYERYKGKYFFLYLLVGIMVFVVAFLILPDSLKDFMYNSFFQNYEGRDITAGRMERNNSAIGFLSYHIFLGNLDQNVSIGWIHNYPLNRTFEFGIVFVIPILVLYLYLLIAAIKNTIKSNSRNNYNIGYYLLLIPFVISMAEPTFPFGPGTATVFNFIVFGASLRDEYNEKANSYSLIKETPY